MSPSPPTGIGGAGGSLGTCSRNDSNDVKEFDELFEALCNHHQYQNLKCAYQTHEVQVHQILIKNLCFDIGALHPNIIQKTSHTQYVPESWDFTK